MKINLKKKEKTLKEERGAISALALFTVFMFMVILMGVYFSITTMQRAQLKSDMRIQDLYSKQIEKADEIYQEKTATCYIGETYYATLQEAINAVASTNTKTTIHITKDFTEANLITIPKEKTVELFLNGKTLTGSIRNYGDLIVNGEGTIHQETSWTIQNFGNCTIAGANITTKTSAYGVIHQEEGGTLTLESGSIRNLAETLAQDTHRAQALEIFGGNATLQEGTISSICGRAIGNHGTIELCGATVTSNCSNTNLHSIYATVCNFIEDSLPAGIFHMTSGSITNTGGGYAVSNTAPSSNFTKTGGTITGTTSGITQ